MHSKIIIGSISATNTASSPSKAAGLSLFHVEHVGAAQAYSKQKVTGFASGWPLQVGRALVRLTTAVLLLRDRRTHTSPPHEPDCCSVSNDVRKDGLGSPGTPQPRLIVAALLAIAGYLAISRTFA